MLPKKNPAVKYPISNKAIEQKVTSIALKKSFKLVFSVFLFSIKRLFRFFSSIGALRKYILMYEVL